MRKFITKTLVNKHADCGIKLIEVDPSTIITSEARDQAFRRGVEFKVIDQADCHMSENFTCTAEEHERIRAQVRTAVIGKLGFETDMVDRAVDAVLERMRL